MEVRDLTPVDGYGSRSPLSSVPTFTGPTFMLMNKQTTITDTSAAIETIKLVTVANLIPTFRTFYAAIDKLKHQPFPPGRSPARPAGTEPRDACRLADGETPL
jgi:hypothetical protein